MSYNLYQASICSGVNSSTSNIISSGCIRLLNPSKDCWKVNPNAMHMTAYSYGNFPQSGLLAYFVSTSSDRFNSDPSQFFPELSK